MTRYAQGFKGPMKPAAGPRVSTAPAQTAQTAPRGTPPPTVRPAGMNPNFKGFGAGPTSFNTDKINQVQGLLKGNAMKKGGSVKASSASKRGDGCAVKGKTKGTMR